MEDRPLGTLSSLAPRAPAMADNISLPSPLSQNHPPPPPPTDGAPPAVHEDTAALHSTPGASPPATTAAGEGKAEDPPR